MKIGIITRSLGTTSKIVTAGQERGHTVYLYNPEKIMLKISKSTNGYDGIYSTDTGEKLIKPDVVLWRAGGSGAIGLALLRYFLEQGVRCSHNATGILNCADKFLTHQLLSKNRSVRNPESIMTADLGNWETAANKIKYPMFIKEIKGSQGLTVYFAKDKLQAQTHVRHLSRAGVKKLVFQQFIKTGDDGVSDFRVFIVNSEVIAIMKRSSDTQMIANVSQGAKGEIGEISDENKAMCLEAAKAVGMQNSVTGIDLLVDNESGDGYIIEANSNPGLKIQDLTGVPVGTKIIEFLENLAGLKPSEVPEGNRTFQAKPIPKPKPSKYGVFQSGYDFIEKVRKETTWASPMIQQEYPRQYKDWLRVKQIQNERNS